MAFLRIRPGSRSPSCAWNNCIIPSKHVKTSKQGSSAEFSCFTPRDSKRPQWNKPFLNTSIFPCCTESRCTEKNQARSMMTSTHASVRCSILVFTDIQSGTASDFGSKLMVLGSNPAVAAALSPWTRLFTPIVPRRSLHISFY